jgi:nicotinamidase-related amidase
LAASLARAEGSVLVLVDIQERLLAAMEAAARAGVVRNARILREAAVCLDVPVLITEQYPKGLGRTAAEVTAGAPAGIPPVEKTCFSCADSAAFQEQLRSAGRPQVVLAGMEAHVCVLQSALGLAAAGWEVFVVEDACCSRNPAHHANAMARLRQAGVIVTNTESVLFEWLRDARHERFRTISALVR